MRRLTSDAGSNEIDGGVDGWDISRSFEKVGALGDLVGLGVGAGVGRGSQTQIWAGWTTIQQSLEYFRTHEAPHYWGLRWHFTLGEAQK